MDRNEFNQAFAQQRDDEDDRDQLILDHTLYLAGRLPSDTLNHQDRENIAQRAAISIIQHIDEIDSDRNPHGYIAKTVQNKAIDLHREKNSRRALSLDRMKEEEGKQVPDRTDFDPLTTLIKHEDRAVLKALLEQLTSEERQVWELKVHDDISNREVGKRLGISTATARDHFISAQERLRLLVKNYTDGTVLVNGVFTQDEADLLSAAIRSIDEKSRSQVSTIAVLENRFFTKHPIPQRKHAEALNVTPTAYRKKLDAALKDLAHEVREQCIESSVDADTLLAKIAGFKKGHRRNTTEASMAR